MMKNISKSILIFAFLFLMQPLGLAQNDPSQVKQTQYSGIVLSAEPQESGGQVLTVEIHKSTQLKEKVTIQTGNTLAESLVKYKKGDKVYVLSITDTTTNHVTYYVTDHNRQSTLFWLFVLFCIVVIVISKKWGIYSIIGMAYSFLIIFKFLLPLLLKGYNPLIIAIITAMLIAPVTFYLAHGFNIKSTVALISTIISLIITGILAHIFINSSKLTGFGTEEAYFLQIAKEGIINIKGIFLAGIVIGALGILDDVTVSQSSIVFQLRNSVKGLDDWNLYKKAMEVGHDHIASTVNTLVLVYAGAALPLLLLFLNSSKTFGEAINTELIADEIVRTLVGSIGMVLAVPISTFIATFFTNYQENGQRHPHS